MSFSMTLREWTFGLGHPSIQVLVSAHTILTPALDFLVVSLTNVLSREFDSIPLSFHLDPIVIHVPFLFSFSFPFPLRTQ